MEWFEEDAGFYGEEYLLHYHSTLPLERTVREVDTIERVLRLRPGEKVLDIPCGHGRHGIELALRGYNVTGVDINGYFLDIARERAEAAQVNATWLKADMRSFSSPVVFDGAITLFTGLGHFVDDAEDGRVLTNIAAALKPGARFLLEHISATSSLFEQPSDSYSLADGSQLTVKRWLSEDRRFVFAKYLRRAPDGSTHERPEMRLRLYTEDELVALARHAGLVHLGSYSGYGLRPLERQSPRMLLLFARE